MTKLEAINFATRFIELFLAYANFEKCKVEISLEDTIEKREKALKHIIQATYHSLNKEILL